MQCLLQEKIEEGICEHSRNNARLFGASHTEDAGIAFAGEEADKFLVIGATNPVEYAAVLVA